MELIVKLLPVLGLAAFELWAAVPTGFALGLHPLVIGITTAVGAILGTLAVVLLGERLRNWLVKRHGGKGQKKHPSLIQRIWHRYGLIGLGLLAPLLTGAPLGAALGLALGAPTGKLLVWLSIGIILWTIILTLIGVLGLAGIETLGKS